LLYRAIGLRKKTGALLISRFCLMTYDFSLAFVTSNALSVEEYSNNFEKTIPNWGDGLMVFLLLMPNETMY